MVFDYHSSKFFMRNLYSMVGLIKTPGISFKIDTTLFKLISACAGLLGKIMYNTYYVQYYNLVIQTYFHEPTFSIANLHFFENRI